MRSINKNQLYFYITSTNNLKIKKNSSYTITLDWLLEEKKEDMNGKAGKIQIKSGVNSKVPMTVS